MPRPPRPKSAKRRLADDDDSDEPAVYTKKSKTDHAEALSEGKDAEGGVYWELGNSRRVQATKFKNTTLINIREYYKTPDGESRPGKKGISLTVDQYKNLLKVLPKLNQDLRAKGVAIGDVEDTADDSDDAPVATTSKASKAEKSSKAKKANIEETSDEDSDKE